MVIRRHAQAAGEPGGCRRAVVGRRPRRLQQQRPRQSAPRLRQPARPGLPRGGTQLHREPDSGWPREAPGPGDRRRHPGAGGSAGLRRPLRHDRGEAVSREAAVPRPDSHLARQHESRSAARLPQGDGVRRNHRNHRFPGWAPPAGAFANTTTASVQQVYNNTLQTGSCGSCHIGEAAGKAGQQLNFNTGGEGRGYTDANGAFFPRRRPMASLIKLRTEPVFPGDALVDALPTWPTSSC